MLTTGVRALRLMQTESSRELDSELFLFCDTTLISENKMITESVEEKRCVVV